MSKTIKNLEYKMEMNISRKLILLLPLLFLLQILEAQPYREPSIEQRITAADKALEEYDYYNAIDLYNDLYRDTRDLTFLPTVANLNYELRDYTRAERYYKRIFSKIKPEEAPELLFHYARTMKQLGDYNQAYQIYKSFQEYSENDSLQTLVKNDIRGMVQARDYEKRYDLYVTSVPEPVNSTFSEYSPAKGPDGLLYFTTFNTRSVIEFDGEEGDWFAKIASSSESKDKEGNKEWKKPTNASRNINKEAIHNSAVAFSGDGKSMFFTRQILQGQEIVKSEIFVSYFDGTEWQGARRLEGVNGEWLALHPSPGELYGEKVLFFVSDMPGGQGGLDIVYASLKGDESYGLPVNLGAVINSKGNEYTPHYVDGKLYFSSDGHPGLGGLDIFRSEWDGSTWSDPKNMELGYNSVNDDYYFKTDAKEQSGYLVSNRPNDAIRSVRSETCCDDIYAIGVREIELELTVGTFSSDKKPLLGATVKLAETFDGKASDYDAVEYTSEKGNTFIFKLQADKNYRIFGSKDGFSVDTFDISTMGVVQSYKYKEFLYLERTEPEVQIITINEPIRLDNIYFNYDDDQILQESESTLEGLKNLMAEYPDLVIELSAHTDARGDDAYNLDLSQRRANSAKRWLIRQGVPDNRVQSVGYGEEQLLNECVNDVECTEEQHRINRRVEFKIIAGPRTIEVKKEVLEGKKTKVKKGVLDIEGTEGNIQYDKPQFDLAENVREDSGDSSDDPIAVLHFKNAFHDFGVIKKGTKVSHTFEFVNAGNKDLVIEMATACECTDLEWPHTPIPPGETGKIDVVYDSTDKEGEQEITVEVLANTESLINTARFRAFVQK